MPPVGCAPPSQYYSKHDNGVLRQSAGRPRARGYPGCPQNVKQPTGSDMAQSGGTQGPPLGAASQIPARRQPPARRIGCIIMQSWCVRVYLDLAAGGVPRHAPGRVGALSDGLVSPTKPSI